MSLQYSPSGLRPFSDVPQNGFWPSIASFAFKTPYSYPGPLCAAVASFLLGSVPWENFPFLPLGPDGAKSRQNRPFLATSEKNWIDGTEMNVILPLGKCWWGIWWWWCWCGQKRWGLPVRAFDSEYADVDDDVASTGKTGGRGGVKGTVWPVTSPLSEVDDCHAYPGCHPKIIIFW